MWKEYKAFLVRGNIVDLAVAVVVGGAFSAIVTSLVNDILMPPIGLFLAEVDFSNLFIDLSGEGYTSLVEAQVAGAATINYGLFISTVITFLISATAVFLLLRAMRAIESLDKEPPAGPTTKECPYCITSISIKATRCPNCTSQLG